MKFFAAKPLAFLASTTSQSPTPYIGDHCNSRFNMLTNQPLPKSRENQLTMLRAKGDVEPDGPSGREEESATGPKKGNVFIERGVRPLQNLLEERRDQSLQHILSGFMTGNVPEFILHGANTFVLGSLLEKLDGCFGKSNSSEIKPDNGLESPVSKNQIASMVPPIDQEVADALQHNLLIILLESPISESLNSEDLTKLKTAALIRLLQAEVAHPGTLKDPQKSSIDSEQAQLIAQLFSLLEREYQLSYDERVRPLEGSTVSHLDGDIEIAEGSLRILLERSAGQPFPPGFCDPKLKFESALRLLNAEIRSPGMLNKSIDVEASPIHEEVAQLYIELTSKHPIDLLWNLDQ